MERSGIINLRLDCLSVRLVYKTIRRRKEVAGPLMSSSKHPHPSNYMTEKILATYKDAKHYHELPNESCKSNLQVLNSLAAWEDVFFSPSLCETDYQVDTTICDFQ